MTRFAIRLLMLFIVVAPFSGCCTILTGTHQNIEFISDPAGASVTSNDTITAGLFNEDSTPCSIAVPRWHTGTISISKEGYKTNRISLQRNINVYVLLDLPWFLLGIVPGIVAVAVDLGTGAIWEFTPRNVEVQLKPQTNRNPPRKGAARRRE